MKQIVILAGGLATRLYPITKDIPKSMVKIKGKPFLEYQLALCKKNKISKVVLCVGHLWEQIEKYFGNGEKFGVRITYSIEKERLDTGGALKNALPYLNDEFFVVYGDSYLPTDWREIYRHFKKTGAEGLMSVYENNWKIESSKILLDNSGFIKEFNKENPRPEMRYTEYGLNILRKDLLAQIKEKSFPIGKYFQILIKKRQLAAYVTKQRFYEIGCHEGLEEIEKILK